MHRLGLEVFLFAVAAALLMGRGRVLFLPKTLNISAASTENYGLYVRILVSLAVLASALYVILSRKFATDQEKWAFGAIGTILGYWLKD